MAFSGEGMETTYGFEVQPIQEYFAASYISDRLPAERAHEIFELLVHRNYWREVALFLAGLRRPNEKADLVARAKAADDRLGDGHQKPGRNMILQLLREGVLDQSRPVLEESMRAVVELLEFGTLRYQRNPEALVEAVCELAEGHEYEGIGARILEFARQCSTSEDEDLLTIVHGVAVRFLPRERYRALLSEYSGTTPLARSVVYMSAPYAATAVLEELATADGYWSGAPMAIWARRLWRAARQHGRIIELDYPRGVHGNLVVEFACDRVHWGDGGRGVLRSGSIRPLAVWRLQQDIDIMHQHIGKAVAGRQEGVGATLEEFGFLLTARRRMRATARCRKSWKGASEIWWVQRTAS